MSDMDIRNWLRENRPDLNVGQRGRLSNEQREIYELGNDELYEDVPEFVPENILSVGDQPPVEEAAPVPPQKKSLFGGFRKSKEERNFEKKAKAPRTPHKRVSTSTVISYGWAGLGGMLGKTPQLAPMGRCLALQAPVAGEVFDDMVKGTILDKALQPFARAGDKGEEAFALLAPPLLVGMVCAQPAVYPMVENILVESMKSWVVIAGPKMKKAKEKEAKLIAELGDDYGDSIREMLQQIFAPVMTEAQENEPAAA